MCHEAYCYCLLMACCHCCFYCYRSVHCEAHLARSQAVSMAVCRAGAAASRMPLYKYIARLLHVCHNRAQGPCIGKIMYSLGKPRYIITKTQNTKQNPQMLDKNLNICCKSNN